MLAPVINYAPKALTTRKNTKNMRIKLNICVKESKQIH